MIDQKEWRENVRPTEEWYKLQRLVPRSVYVPFPIHLGPNKPASVRRAEQRAKKAKRKNR